MSRIVREKSRFSRVPSTASPKVEEVQSKVVREKSNFQVLPKTSKIIRNQEIKPFPITTTQKEFQLPESDQIDVLPDVVRSYIIDQMDVGCHELRGLKNNPNFSKFVTNQRITKAKDRGFPRTSGRTKVYYVKFYKDEFGQLHDFPEYYNADRLNKLWNKYNFVDEIGKELQDLVKGDVVKIYTPKYRVYNSTVFYDGCNFLEHTEFRKQFVAFKDNLSFTYFTNENNGPILGIDKIAVNLFPYREEILANLAVGFGAQVFRSNFLVDGQRYNITFNVDDQSDIEDYLNYDSPLSVEYVNRNTMKW